MVSICVMKVKENTNSFLCIELIFKEVIIRNYAKSNVQVFMNVLSKYPINQVLS